MATWARAHPNIALIKYWGKAPGPGNRPASPSLSITLDRLETRTRVVAAQRDSVQLNDRPVEDAKLAAWLGELRREFDIPPLDITTWNNFPTGAGLASSASGFAALITAIDAECSLQLDRAARSSWARRGSGSAARSIVGGFAQLSGPNWCAEQLLDERTWPLQVVIAVTDPGPKSTSSTQGMQASARSPYFEAWTQSTLVDFQQGLDAVAKRDFRALAAIAEHSCLKMHGLMLATPPGLIYWKAATVAAIDTVRAQQAQGLPVFFTIDAGPQVKAVCQAEATEPLAAALRRTPGVTEVLVAGLGPGAHCFTP